MNSNRKIWSDAINEELLCETLLGLGENGSEQKADMNFREIESYPYKNKTREEKYTQRARSSSEIRNVRKNRSGEAIEESNIHGLQSRLGPTVVFDEKKTRSHINVTELDSEDAVTKAIAKNLNEHKYDLIGRIYLF